MSDSASSWMPAMARPMYVGGGSLGRYLADGEGLEGAYLEAGGHPLTMATYDAGDGLTDLRQVSPEELDSWASGVDPSTGGKLRTMRAGSVGSFDQALTVPRGLAVAAVCWPGVRSALDGAMTRAMAATRAMVAEEMRVKIGPRGRQRLVRPDEVRIVTARHDTSRAGDPHPHWHMVVVSQARVGDRWYAIDSDRLFRLHGRMQGVWGTALYADPMLRAELAAHHLTLGADGSLPSLEAEAQVLSTRARQIEARIGELTEAWRRREGAPAGTMPPARIRGQIKRQAWAETRRKKTAETTRVDYQAWYQQLLDAGYDPRTRLDALGPLPMDERAMWPRLDQKRADQLGLAVVARLSAARSAWSRDDVDAVAWAVLRETGLIADPATLRGLHQTVTQAALARCESLSDHSLAQQAWTKSLTSRQVIEESQDLSGRLAARAVTPLRAMDRRDADLLEGLDAGQAQAVRAIIAGDAIVEGAAGAGKTYALSRVVAWHERHHIGIRLLTPTLQAAQAAAEETGAAAGTVDGLLWSYGWRRDPETGQWRQLRLGDADTMPDGTPSTYRGVPAGQVLPHHGTIVVDEAGMVSADKARILYQLADAAGCRVALIGDSRQLSQIGRGGLMDLAHDWLDSGQQVEMTTLHRFKDRAYGDWTLAVRACTPDRARAMAEEMLARGMVRVHSTDQDTAARIAAQWTPRTTLIASTNQQVDQINALVQARRIEAGELRGDGLAVPDMVEGEAIRAGDIVQTRKNDKSVGVANRMRWRVREVRAGGGLLVQDLRTHRDVELDAAYVREHVQLGYASTAHGAQGATAEKGVAWISDRTDRAGLYVAITRGKGDNLIHVTAADQVEAVDLLTAALRRDGADRGLAAAKATLAAQIADAATTAQDGPQTAEKALQTAVPAREAPTPISRPATPQTAPQPRSVDAKAAAAAAREMRIITDCLARLGRRIGELEAEQARPGASDAYLRDLETAIAAHRQDHARGYDRLRELDQEWGTDDATRDAWIAEHETKTAATPTPAPMQERKPQAKQTAPSAPARQTPATPAAEAKEARPAPPPLPPRPAPQAPAPVREEEAVAVETPTQPVQPATPVEEPAVTAPEPTQEPQEPASARPAQPGPQPAPTAAPVQDVPQQRQAPQEPQTEPEATPQPATPAVEPLDDRRARHLEILEEWAGEDGLADTWRATVADGQAASAGLDRTRAEHATVRTLRAEAAGQAAHAHEAAGQAAQAVGDARQRAHGVAYGPAASMAQGRLLALGRQLRALDTWEQAWRDQLGRAERSILPVRVTLPPQGADLTRTDPAQCRRTLMGAGAAADELRLRLHRLDQARAPLDGEDDELRTTWGLDSHAPAVIGEEQRAHRIGHDPAVLDAQGALDRAKADAKRAEQVLDGLARQDEELDARERALEARVDQGRDAAARLGTLTGGTPAARHDLLDGHYRPAMLDAWQEAHATADPSVEDRWTRLAAMQDADPAAPIWTTSVDLPDGTVRDLGGLVWDLAPTDADPDHMDAVELCWDAADTRDRASLDPVLIDTIDRHAIGLDDPGSADIRAQALAGTHADPAAYDPTTPDDPTQLAPAIEPPRPRRHHLGL